MFSIARKQNSLKCKMKANYNVKDKMLYKTYFKNKNTAIRKADSFII